MRSRPIGTFWRWAVILFFLAYLVAPVIAIFIFSVSGEWQDTVLPETWTLGWYPKAFADPMVKTTILRSFYISFLTVVLSFLLVTPTAYLTSLRFPTLRPVLEFLAVLPFALPGTILAIGLIQIYSSGPIPIANTVYILLLAYIVTTLPFMFHSISNSLASINAKVLTEAALSLGASEAAAFWHVIVPNILPGMVSGALLTFAACLGEFTLANLLVGTSFKTFQVFLVAAINVEGHISSALVMVYFAMVAASAMAVFFVTRGATYKQITAAR